MRVLESDRTVGQTSSVSKGASRGTGLVGLSNRLVTELIGQREDRPGSIPGRAAGTGLPILRTLTIRSKMVETPPGADLSIRDLLDQLRIALGSYESVDAGQPEELWALSKVVTAARGFNHSWDRDLGEDEEPDPALVRILETVTTPLIEAGKREMRTVALDLLARAGEGIRERYEELDGHAKSAGLFPAADALGDAMAQIETPLLQPASGEGFGYRHVNGPLFDGEPSPDDVTQGAVGDCWMLGPLAAAASTPRGRESIRQVVTGAAPRFTVRFFERDGSDFVLGPPISVVSSFPVTQAGTFAYGLATRRHDRATPLWPVVIEKAWAQREGGYSRLEGGREKAGVAFEAIMGASGSEGLGGSLRDLAAAKKEILARLGAGHPVALATANHWVTVLSATSDKVTLRDQSLLKKSGGALTFDVTWEQVAGAFRVANARDYRFESYATLTERLPAPATSVVDSGEWGDDVSSWVDDDEDPFASPVPARKSPSASGRDWGDDSSFSFDDDEDPFASPPTPRRGKTEPGDDDLPDSDIPDFDDWDIPEFEFD